MESGGEDMKPQGDGGMKPRGWKDGFVDSSGASDDSEAIDSSGHDSRGKGQDGKKKGGVGGGGGEGKQGGGLGLGSDDEEEDSEEGRSRMVAEEAREEARAMMGERENFREVKDEEARAMMGERENFREFSGAFSGGVEVGGMRMDKATKAMLDYFEKDDKREWFKEEQLKEPGVREKVLDMWDNVTSIEPSSLPPSWTVSSSTDPVTHSKEGRGRHVRKKAPPGLVPNP
ncbi:hypothetical protein T484DRAFT_1838074 [Baffinella frigidus]|nr:hypothetical protein T484DRAFT_1838074 [Cryptophyta sp. CCMP2293]